MRHLACTRMSVAEQRGACEELFLFYLLIYLSVCLFLYSSIHLFIYAIVYLCSHSYIYLDIQLYIHLSTQLGPLQIIANPMQV